MSFNVRHDEITPTITITSTPVHLVELTQTENNRMLLYSGFVRRRLLTPCRSYMGMKAGTRIYKPQMV